MPCKLKPNLMSDNLFKIQLILTNLSKLRNTIRRSIINPVVGRKRWRSPAATSQLDLQRTKTVLKSRPCQWLKRIFKMRSRMRSKKSSQLHPSSNKISRNPKMMRRPINANRPWPKDTMLGQKTNSLPSQSTPEMLPTRDWTSRPKKAAENMRKKRELIKSQDKKMRTLIMKMMDKWQLKRFISNSKGSRRELKLKSRPKLRNKLDLEQQCRAIKKQDTHSSVLETWPNRCWTLRHQLQRLRDHPCPKG